MSFSEFIELSEILDQSIELPCDLCEHFNAQSLDRVLYEEYSDSLYS